MDFTPNQFYRRRIVDKMTGSEAVAMTKTKTDKLYVNLSASQVRKRLKGHGFGVKKVESADRNQAVIIHTATGQHLRELEALLADVLASTSQEELGIPVENLRNLGSTSAQWLREIGVHTRDDLQQMGPVIAYRLVKRRQPSANLNLLWAMAAALADQDWRELSPQDKERLRQRAEEE